MKQQWKSLKIEQVCLKVTDGSHYSPTHSDEGYLMASSKDMLENGFNYENIKTISKREYFKLVEANCKPQIGDILIIKDGNSYLKYIFSVKKEEEIVLLSSIAILRPDQTVVDSLFLQYLLRSPDMKNQLKNYVSGAAIPRIVLNDFKKAKLVLPTFPTQQKIARILSAYDDLIESNLKRIKLLEEMAQITYEEWFVRMKFPGHEQAVIDSETGLPEGWQKGMVVDLFELQRGFDLPIQDREYGETPILASTGVAGFHSSCKVKGPGVITGRSGTIGHAIFVDSDFWSLNTTLWVKKYKSCGPLFVKHFLGSFNLKRIGGGSAVPSLDRKAVHSQKIILPSPKLMKDFESYAQSLFAPCRVFNLQNQLLKEVRDILLPRLVTGMIDVDTLEVPEILANKNTHTDTANNREASLNAL